MTIGEKIKQVRSQKGLTIRSLSELSGLNIATISHVENGKVKPNSITIARLARTLELDFDELIKLSD